MVDNSLSGVGLGLGSTEDSPPALSSSSSPSSPSAGSGTTAAATTTALFPTPTTQAQAHAQSQFVENASDLSFGTEFEDIHILSNAQVAVILQVSARSALNRDEELHDVYRKTQKYVERFNTMTNPEKDHQELVDELDNLQDALSTFRKETEEGEEMELHKSEVAALMNLVATDTMVEEAVALIPSLSRFPEPAIEEILDLIRSTMIRIVS